MGPFLAISSPLASFVYFSEIAPLAISSTLKSRVVVFIAPLLVFKKNTNVTVYRFYISMRRVLCPYVSELTSIY